MTFSNPRNLFYIRLYALLLIGTGLFIALIVSKHGSLNCDRTIGRCQFEGGNLFQVDRQNFSIQNLGGATIETKISRDRHGRVSTGDRVVLQHEDTLIIENYWGGKKPQQISAEINTFIKNPQQQSLQVSQDERLFGVLCGICLITAGTKILKRSQQT
jgi:hypothetical protein